MTPNVFTPVERAQKLLSMASLQGPWIIEPHGKETALYAGRSGNRHGWRLMNLSDGDSNFGSNLLLIEEAPKLLQALCDEIDSLKAARPQINLDFLATLTHPQVNLDAWLGFVRNPEMEWLGMPLDASDSVTSFRLLNSARMFGHRGPDSSTRP